MKRIVLLLLILGAATAAPAADLPVEEHVLANGMTILLLPRKTSPTVSTYLRLKVGSADEIPGKTGIAHMLEHMMFKGTRRLGTTSYEAEAPLLDRIDALRLELERLRDQADSPFGQGDAGRIKALEGEIDRLEVQAKTYVVKNEIWEIYRRNGGVGLNASTGRDGTQYYISLPKNRLELWARIESDRLREPVFREFYSERDVVQEERRQRVDIRVEGRMWEVLFATAFNALPYRHPILGWPGDIARFLRPDALAYFRTYYAPNNAIVVLVGDFDPAETLALIRRHFESIPAQPMPAPRVFHEPAQGGERHVQVEFDANPQLLVAYRAVPVGHPDSYVLSVIGAILSDGRMGRLYRRLVEGPRLAASVDAGPILLRSGGLFTLSGVPRAPHSADELEAALAAELDRLKRDPVGERELERVRNQLDAAFIRSLVSNASLAAQLGNAKALTGDWRFILTSRERMKAVTADDILRVARATFVLSQRTVVTVVPTKGRETGPGTRLLGREEPVAKRSGP